MAYNIAVLILAAGRSERMGPENKLLASIDDKPMIAYAVEAALASAASTVLVVTGHEAEQVKDSLTEQKLSFVHNPDYRDGLASSLKTGLKALPGEVDGVLICLGDMPLVSAEDLDALIDDFYPKSGKTICVPIHEGQQGNPVLWGAQHLPELLALEGDQGAKQLIAKHKDAIIRIERGPGILRDIDDAAALKAFRSAP